MFKIIESMVYYLFGYRQNDKTKDQQKGINKIYLLVMVKKKGKTNKQLQNYQEQQLHI